MRRGASVVASSETRRSKTTQTRRTAGAMEEEEIPSSHSQSQIHSFAAASLGLGQRVRGERESGTLARERREYESCDYMSTLSRAESGPVGRGHWVALWASGTLDRAVFDRVRFQFCETDPTQKNRSFFLKKPHSNRTSIKPNQTARNSAVRSV